MTTAIVQQSIFDSIRKTDEQGNEFWYARDLMPILGYKKWQFFEDTISKAQFACQNSGASIDKHFKFLLASVKTGGAKGGRPGNDFKLSRYASYLVAMNGDPRKTEIAQAQTYFAVKTNEAETVIPAQSEALRLAELEITRIKAENEQLKMQIRLQELLIQNKQIDSSMLAMHGVQVVMALRGKSDQMVEVEKPTLEIIDEKTGAKFKGMSLNQLKDYANQKYGIRFKSGAEIARFLESSGNGHLIAQTPRRVLTDYIPDEFIADAIKALSTNHRQLLIGETELN